MARNLTIFSMALILGLGLAWLLLGEHGPRGGVDGIDRHPGESSAEDARSEGANGGAGRDARDGPVLFGRPRAERTGRGGVAGRVAGVEDDTSIEGAQLLLAGVGFGDEPVQLRGLSLADGTFLLPEVPAGDDYVLRVTAEGKPERTWPGISVRDGVVTRLGTVWLGAQLDFEGRVVDAAGLGIAGADVRLFVGHFSLGELVGRMAELFADLDREPEAQATALTDADGVFRFRAVDPGAITLSVRAPAFTPGFLKAVVAPTSASSPAVVIRLNAGAVVAGTVVDGSGLGLGGARIAVLGSGDPFGFMYGRSFVDTHGDGSFRIDTAGGKKVKLLTTCPGYPLTMTRVEPGDESVRIVLARGAELVVRLLSEPDDRPVEGAQIMVATSGSGALDETSQCMSIGTTDRTGSVTFEVKPGTLQMAMVTHPSRPSGMWTSGGPVSMPGSLKGPEDVRVGTGRREVVFRMQDTVLVRGRVTDEAGAAIAEASVMTFGGFQFGRPVRTGKDGDYELPIARGRFGLLLVRASGYVQARESLGLQIGEGGVIEKDVTLGRAAVVSGRVLDESGRPVPGAQVKVDTGQRGGMGVALQILGLPSGVTATSGRYVLDGVSPGEKVRIVAHRTGYVDQATEWFEVTAGRSLTGKDVTLTQGATLEVQVEDPNGSPLAGARVEIVTKREDAVQWDALRDFTGGGVHVTDRHGRARAASVAPGPATVTATHANWASAAVDVTVAGGQASAVTVTVTLRRPVTISGTVLGEKDQPVEGASLVVLRAGDRAGWVSTRTGASGRFRLERVPEGPVTIRVSAPGHEQQKVDVTGPAEGLVVRLAAEDMDRAARQQRALSRLAEISEQLEAATSEEERRALQREIQALQPDLPGSGR